jgi:hypothetical protein
MNQLAARKQRLSVIVGENGVFGALSATNFARSENAGEMT